MAVGPHNPVAVSPTILIFLHGLVSIQVRKKWAKSEEEKLEKLRTQLKAEEVIFSSFLFAFSFFLHFALFSLVCLSVLRN